MGSAHRSDHVCVRSVEHARVGRTRTLRERTRHVDGVRQFRAQGAAREAIILRFPLIYGGARNFVECPWEEQLSFKCSVENLRSTRWPELASEGARTRAARCGSVVAVAAKPPASRRGACKYAPGGPMKGRLRRWLPTVIACRRPQGPGHRLQQCQCQRAWRAGTQPQDLSAAKARAHDARPDHWHASERAGLDNGQPAGDIIQAACLESKLNGRNAEVK